MEQQIETLIGQYGWMGVVAFVLLIGRKTIESTIEAIKVFAGDDLNTDDVIIFNDRPARVIRVGLWKTILLSMRLDVLMENPLLKVVTK